MKTFEYKILRYLHDRVTGEFVNVGILLFALDEKILFSRTSHTYGRLADFYCGIDGKKVKKLITGIDYVVNKFNKESLSLSLNFDNITNLDSFINQILPTDDSALLFTETKRGLTLDYENTLESLFSEIVAKYESSYHQKSTNDSEAWRNVYKKYFDKYRLTEKLVAHKIKTKVDEFEFEHCWKNGSWNIYKPISFDLAEDKYIKEKIYRWDGILRELESAKEPVNINFLAISPKQVEDKSLLKIIQSKLVNKSRIFNSNVIFEDEAEAFVSDLKSEIENH